MSRKHFEDFVDWDDIDLDDLLRESGFNEEECAIDNEPSWSGSAKSKPAKRKKRASKSLPSSKEKLTTEVFLELVKAALSAIKTDVQHSNPESRHGLTIIRMAEGAETLGDDDWTFLHERFSALQLNLRGGIKVGQEKMFSNFHSLRVDKQFLEQFSDLLSTTSCESDSLCRCQFIQIFLSELLDEHLRKETTRKPDPAPQEKLSKQDQEVLHYVCGYIINKLLWDKHLSSDEKIILGGFLTTANDNKENSSTWTKRLDRGGLKYPTREAVAFFRKAETLLRELWEINQERDTLLESLMTSEHINRAWSLLVPGFCHCMDLCKKLLRKYLTVRGFAMAKYYKRVSLSKTQTKGANKASLRKALKEKQ